VDPANPDTVYAALEVGVWRSTDAGTTWTSLNKGLPNALVKDLVFHAPTRMLRAATQSRGVWELAVDPVPLPDVAIYIRDSSVDTGRATPSPSGVDDPFNLGQQTFWWNCVDIKVDAPPYQRPAVDDIDFDTFADDHGVVAQSALQSARYDLAVKHFEWLAQRQPDSAPTHILMAEALDGLGRSDEAIAEMQAAVQRTPKQPDVHFGLGYLLWKAHRDDEAEREFRAELSNDPSHAKAAAWLGDVLLKRGDNATAQLVLEKAVRLSPGLRIAHLDLGILYADQKSHTRAIQHLREAVRLDPSRTDARFRLARLYRGIGREQEAKAELAAIERITQKDTEESLHRVQERRPEPVKP
jgi:tetratricopeptide (TPR) repeat protein